MGNWVLDYAEQQRAIVRESSFFPALSVGRLTWLHQLRHQSGEFTRALSLRSATCRDVRYQAAFAEHAAEEAQHPADLDAWMRVTGMSLGPVDEVPATDATIATLAYCWRSAIAHPPHLSVLALNVISEGVALDFYTAVIPELRRRDMLVGRYWKVHTEVDTHHMHLGLDVALAPCFGSEAAARWVQVMTQTATLYRAMLDSWAKL